MRPEYRLIAYSCPTNPSTGNPGDTISLTERSMVTDWRQLVCLPDCDREHLAVLRRPAEEVKPLASHGHLVRPQILRGPVTLAQHLHSGHGSLRVDPRAGLEGPYRTALNGVTPYAVYPDHRYLISDLGENFDQLACWSILYWADSVPGVRIQVAADSVASRTALQAMLIELAASYGKDIGLGLHVIYHPDRGRVVEFGNGSRVLFCAPHESTSDCGLVITVQQLLDLDTDEGADWWTWWRYYLLRSLEPGAPALHLFRSTVPAFINALTIQEMFLR